MSSTTRPHRKPAITIDAALVDQLQGLAFSAMNRMPALADRLLEEIDRARLLPASRLPKTVVTLGSEVTFQDDVTGKVQTVVLVLPPEADIGKRRASVLTPIGVALAGIVSGSILAGLLSQIVDMPEAVATQLCAPSSAARRSSNIDTVGLP